MSTFSMTSIRHRRYRDHLRQQQRQQSQPVIRPGWPDSCRPIDSVHLTVKQQQPCRRAIGITRFVFNRCVATKQLCRINRLPWPSWQDLYKSFNAGKREACRFVTEVASGVAKGAFIDFGTAIKNWRDRCKKGRLWLQTFFSLL